MYLMYLWSTYESHPQQVSNMTLQISVTFHQLEAYCWPPSRGLPWIINIQPDCFIKLTAFGMIMWFPTTNHIIEEMICNTRTLGEVLVTLTCSLTSQTQHGLVSVSVFLPHTWKWSMLRLVESGLWDYNFGMMMQHFVHNTGSYTLSFLLHCYCILGAQLINCCRCKNW